MKAERQLLTSRTKSPSPVDSHIAELPKDGLHFDERKPKPRWHVYGILYTALIVLCHGWLVYEVRKRLQSANAIKATVRFDTVTFRNGYRYFIVCLIAGMTSGLGHVIVTPIDSFKCRSQAGEFTSIQDDLNRIRSMAHGSPVLFIYFLYTGFVPTILAYCLQGGMKYYLYEVLKCYLAATSLSCISYPLSSMLAEFVADIFLVPWEAVKLRMQLNPFSSSHMMGMMYIMYDREGLNAFYGSLVSLWYRQIPLTMAKFTFFELTARVVYRLLHHFGFKSKSSLGVTILSSVVAGTLAGIVSHPADTVLSLTISGQHGFQNGGNFFTKLIIAYRKKILFKGLVLRLFMVSLVSIFQWTFYDAVRVHYGYLASGS